MDPSAAPGESAQESDRLPGAGLRNAVRPLTALVTALSEEAAELRHRLAKTGTVPEDARGGVTASGGLRSVSTGWLSGVPVVVAVTGDGERNARLGVQALLETVAPDRLVALGVAGGLAPELKLGDLVVASHVLREGAAPLRPPASVLSLALRATGAAEGVVVTGSRLADTPAAKAELYRWSWGQGGRECPAVVDLESSFYAAAAEEAGIPWVVIRAVSDTASEALPSYLNQCRDSGGSVRRTPVLGWALRRPTSIPILLRLRGRVRRNGKLLADAAERLIVEWDSAGHVPAERQWAEWTA